MTYLVFSALVWKAIDFIRSLSNYRTQESAIATQLAAWIGGILMVMVGAHAKVADALTIPGSAVALGKLDLASQVLVGMLVASLAGTGVDLKQAFDRSDSAAKPPMFGEDPQETSAPVTARGAADAYVVPPAPHVTVNIPTPTAPAPAGNVIQVPLTPEPAPAVTAEQAALVAARQEAAEAAGAAHAAAESAAAALERAEAAAARAAHLEAPPTPQE